LKRLNRPVCSTDPGGLVRPKCGTGFVDLAKLELRGKIEPDQDISDDPKRATLERMAADGFSGVS
jgi:hypothetical protein